MRGIRLSLVLASIAVVGLALWAGAFCSITSGGRMADAADRFLKSLDKDQAARALSPVRLRSSGSTGTSSPGPRKGVPIRSHPAQRRWRSA